MTSHSSTRRPYVLGLDIGANSIGWAALAVNASGESVGFVGSAAEMRTRPSLGVRIFDEGVENYGMGEREVGRGQKRRSARLQRRQIMRRARRIAKTYRILQEMDLLPPFEDGSVARLGRSRARDATIKRLDESLSQDNATLDPAQATFAFELLPYFLRAQALDRRLSPHELGRALYHLAQRRGFASNRKAGKKEDETGEVKKGISELSKAIAERHSRTLGEHLLNEAEAGRRIRNRWTARSMYVDEFERIWEQQASHYSDRLTAEAKRRLKRAIFFQRPLRSQRDLIGACEWESGDEYVQPETGVIRKTRRRRRAPECFLISQRFRLLQSVNHLAIERGEGLPSIPLDADQKRRLANELERVEKLTFPKVAALLGLPKNTRFNLQAGGDKSVPGNRTNAQLWGLFGDRWNVLEPEARNQIVLELWGAPNDEALVQRAKSRKGVWDLLRPTASEAESLRAPALSLSPDYLALSKQAMTELVAVMENGVPYTTATRSVYGERVRRTTLDSLPPVSDALGSLRNPGVMRALTELRRVVNHLIKLHGRPEEIRVELARDLKKSKDERNRIIRANRDLEKERRAAAERALTEGGLTEVRGGDILKIQLANECNWVCPYSGQQFGMSQLLGGDIDVEHIIPYSLCLDDSYMNKTLCLAHVNRSEKSNRSPFEAFGHDHERWNEMIARMERNVSNHHMHKAKLERFQLSGDGYREAIEQFKSSQLNDTRYASRAAKEYLAALYGGNLAQGTDEHGRKRVLVGNGQATALVRRQLGMEGVLRRTKHWPTVTGPDWDKRADHRHHAMDAVAVALTGTAMLQQLSRSAEKSWEERRRAFSRMSAPWDGFEDELRSCLDAVAISFRISNRARGPLHAETNYSPPRNDSGQRTMDGAFSHIRKPIDRLSNRDLKDIVDSRIRHVVSTFFGDRDPAKVCRREDASTYPALEAKDGRQIGIRRVRLRKRNSTYPVGDTSRERHVENEANHHLVVKDSVDKKGARRIVFELVPMMEAVRRRATGGQVVQRDSSVLFTLAHNDAVELQDADGRRLCRVLGTSEKEFEGCWASDARSFEIRKRVPGARVRISPSKVRDLECRKLAISPIGVVRPCRA